MLRNEIVSIILGVVLATANADSGKFPERRICGTHPQNRIGGGKIADLTDFPWLALLKYGVGDSISLCSGTLINAQYVVTAAHCVSEDGKFFGKYGQVTSVTLGEWNVETEKDCIVQSGFQQCNDAPVSVAVESVTTHPDYNYPNIENDIALVRLAKKVDFSKSVKPICLPLKTEQVVVGNKLWITGWGTTDSGKYSPIKLTALIRALSNEECVDKFPVKVTDSHICAGGVDNTCSGDGGGPLMQETRIEPPVWLLQGITSSANLECGTNNLPEVFVRVADYIEWIEENVQD